MNNFTSVCNLTKDPEVLTLGGREVMKIRLACNTFGKQAETRFFDALVSGPDVAVARQLKQGDQIVISGTLTKTSYKSKAGKNKGKTMEADSMPFGKIIQITKSPTFFGGEGKPGAGDDEGSDEAPDLGDDADPRDADDGVDPLADVV